VSALLSGVLLGAPMVLLGSPAPAGRPWPRAARPAAGPGPATARAASEQLIGLGGLSVAFEADTTSVVPGPAPPPASSPAPPPAATAGGGAPAASRPGPPVTLGAAAPVAERAPSGSSAPAQSSPVAARSVTGVATWYAAAPAGECASPTLPFGTVVTVTSVLGGARTVCTVEDREASTPGRVIDLSEAGFSQLAPLGQGVVTVVVTW